VKNKIKQFLNQRGITAYQFRKDVGIAQRTAYDLYNNPEQLPSSTVLSKICDTYQVQPGEILEWIPSHQDSGHEIPAESDKENDLEKPIALNPGNEKLNPHKHMFRPGEAA
jgi:DNA-binding Xre family transcriptional regulator